MDLTWGFTCRTCKKTIFVETDEEADRREAKDDFVCDQCKA